MVLYQIKRCSAPWSDAEQKDYQSIEDAIEFISEDEEFKKPIQEMENASKELDYEKAASKDIKAFSQT